VSPLPNQGSPAWSTKYRSSSETSVGKRAPPGPGDAVEAGGATDSVTGALAAGVPLVDKQAVPPTITSRTTASRSVPSARIDHPPDATGPLLHSVMNGPDRLTWPPVKTDSIRSRGAAALAHADPGGLR